MMVSFHGFAPGGGYNSNSDALKDIVPPPPAVTQSSAAGRKICRLRRSERFCNVSAVFSCVSFISLRFLHVSFKRKRMRRAQGMAVDPADRRSAYSKGVDQRGRGPVLAGGEGRKL